VKTEAQKKKEARLRQIRALQRTKKRLGLGPAKPPRGDAQPAGDEDVATTAETRSHLGPDTRLRAREGPSSRS
jgi:hypothetical protein